MLVSSLQAFPTSTANVSASRKKLHPQERFGFIGSGMLNPTPFFQLITESFMWNFFVQDFFSLWVPRVSSALRRGRDKYNPETDPKFQKGKPLRQWMRHLYKNVAGLNYKNSWEETLREVETGPGIFVFPAAIVGWSASKLWGKHGAVLSTTDLKDYQAALTRTLKSPELLKAGILQAGTSAQQVEKGILKHFLEDMLLKGKSHFLQQEGLLREIGVNAAADLPDVDKTLVKYLKTIAPQKLPGKVTYQEALTHWIHQWAETLPTKNWKWFNDPYVLKLEEMNTVFDRLVFYFNDKVLKIKNPEKLAELTVNMPAGVVQEKTAAKHFLENLRKFKTYIMDVNRMAHQHVQGPAATGWTQRLKTALLEASEVVYAKAAKNKLLAMTASVFITGIALICISAIAQHDKAYPANRKVKLEDLSEGGPKPGDTATAKSKKAKNSKPPSHRNGQAMENPFAQQMNPNVYPYQSMWQPPSPMPAAYSYGMPAYNIPYSGGPTG